MVVFWFNVSMCRRIGSRVDSFVLIGWMARTSIIIIESLGD